MDIEGPDQLARVRKLVWTFVVHQHCTQAISVIDMQKIKIIDRTLYITC